MSVIEAFKGLNKGMKATLIQVTLT